MMLSISSVPRLRSMLPTRSREQLQAKLGLKGSNRVMGSCQNNRRKIVSTSSVSSSSDVSVQARMAMRW